MKKILFLCGHNAGRSIMAEAYFNAHNQDETVRAISAGTHPTIKINPVARGILEDEGIDTSRLHPKKLIPEMLENVIAIYSMGCGPACHKLGFPVEITEDLGLEDPHGKNKAEILEIFAKLKKKIKPLFSLSNSVNNARSS